MESETHQIKESGSGVIPPEQPENVDEIIEPIDIGTQLDLGNSTKKVDLDEAPTKQVSQFSSSP